MLKPLGERSLVKEYSQAAHMLLVKCNGGSTLTERSNLAALMVDAA